VGKSTLINKLIGEKITITSPIAQTTRNKLKGILTKENGQIIFVDTPGVHKPHHRLGEILVKNAKSAINGVDMVIFVIDTSEEPGRGDEYILNFLIANKTEFIVALNKWDLVNKEFRNLRLQQYRRFFGINRNFQIVNKIYSDFFNIENPPARACVEVSSLPKGVLVEIDCVAFLD